MRRLGDEFITVLDSEVAEDLEDGGLVQVVRTGTSAVAAFTAAAVAADSKHTKLRVFVCVERVGKLDPSTTHQGQGIKIGGNVFDITTANIDWAPIRGKFQGIVIVSVGYGIGVSGIN